LRARRRAWHFRCDGFVLGPENKGFCNLIDDGWNRSNPAAPPSCRAQSEIDMSNLEARTMRQRVRMAAKLQHQQVPAIRSLHKVIL
jgi:hypothetical protein